MDGVEQTATSDSENTIIDDSEKGLIRVLVPNLEDRAEDMDCLKESIRIEWLGTSTFFLAHNIELQEVVSSINFLRIYCPRLLLSGIALLINIFRATWKGSSPWI